MVYISTFLFVHYVEGKESSEQVWSISVHSCLFIMLKVKSPLSTCGLY